MEESATSLDNLVLITGGAKSGKSLLAEELASCRKSNVYYIATMPRIEGDDELLDKINAHKNRRPAAWQTREAVLDIDKIVSSFDSQKNTCIIDCLSAYVSNIMINSQDFSHSSPSAESLNKSLVKLIGVIQNKPETQFIVVTNEVGWSVVPENQSARLFRELLGSANQLLASKARTVYLCCSGITLKIKSEGKTVLN